MADDKDLPEAAPPEVDERSIAKRYGLKPLVYPDREQIKALVAFLDDAIEHGRCGPLPKLGLIAVLDFLQATVNRQHITKGPRMSHEEFDAIQSPYYIAARVVTKIQRERQEPTKGKIYQTTYLSLNHFIELLRTLLDPGCYWIRAKVPEGVREAMAALREFLVLYPEQQRKGRAL